MSWDDRENFGLKIPYIIFFIFGQFFIRRFYPLRPTVMGLESKDVEKFARGCPPTQTPTQKLKSVFSTISSQKTGSSSVSLEIIFTLFNLSYSMSSFILWVQKFLNSHITIEKLIKSSSSLPFSFQHFHSQ